MFKTFKLARVDSEYCDSGKIIFLNQRLVYRENLMILIEYDDNMKIGAFVFDKLIYDNWNDIEISNSFLFTFTNNEMKSFKQKNVKVQISLFSKITDCYLFEIGEDIEISRKENELKCLCKKEDYDLQGYENILLDKEKGKNVEFTPKRIQVIQFYETEYQKQQRG